MSSIVSRRPPFSGSTSQSNDRRWMSIRLGTSRTLSRRANERRARVASARGTTATPQGGMTRARGARASTGRRQSATSQDSTARHGPLGGRSALTDPARACPRMWRGGPTRGRLRLSVDGGSVETPQAFGHSARERPAHRGWISRWAAPAPALARAQCGCGPQLSPRHRGAGDGWATTHEGRPFGRPSVQQRRESRSYLSSTVAPASSSSALSLSASSRSMPSLTGLGASSTSALASLRPRPVAARTTLMTWIFLSPAPVRTTSTVVDSSSAAASPPPPPASGGRDGRGGADAELLLERLDALGELEHARCP